MPYVPKVTGAAFNNGWDYQEESAGLAYLQATPSTIR